MKFLSFISLAWTSFYLFLFFDLMTISPLSASSFIMNRGLYLLVYLVNLIMAFRVFFNKATFAKIALFVNTAAFVYTFFLAPFFDNARFFYFGLNLVLAVLVIKRLNTVAVKNS